MAKDKLTTAVPVKTNDNDEVRVMIRLPRLEDAGSGIKVDPYEHVSISNEHGDQFIRVKRGEPVEVTVPVYEQLKQRYPDI